MKSHRLLVFSVVAFLLVASACAPATPAAMPKVTATSQAMSTPAAMTEATVTPGAMMQDTATAEAMMEATATPAAMMGDTPTPAAMMGDTPTPAAMMGDTPTPAAMMGDTATPAAMMEATGTPAAMMEAPAWLGAALTDVSRGTTFTLNDFKGKVILVETMALSCSTCEQQQVQIKALLAKLGMPVDLVVVDLDIAPNEDGSRLSAYAAKNGFDWIYAVAPAQVATEIGNLYGSQFLQPASAPLLVIDRKGVAHALPAGLKSADDLEKSVEPYLKGM